MNDKSEIAGSMDSRDRVAAAVRRGPLDRIPMDMWYTAETAQKLNSALGSTDDIELRDALGLDVVWVWAEFAGELPSAQAGATTMSYWGFGYRDAVYDGGTYQEYCHQPLAGIDSLQQVDDYAWPDPAAFDFASLPDKIAAANVRSEKWVGVGESAIFERAWGLVGLEEFLALMLTEPKLAYRIMEKINDVYIEQTLNTLRACNGRADMVYIADDVGSQQGMLIGPGLWRDLIKPLQKKFNDAIRAQYPATVFHYHCCGSILPIIDDLIEIGVDILNPIQPKAAGMNADDLAARWGDSISFLGGLDTQDLLPHGSAEEVYDECLRLIETLGKGGGYILAPAHAVQVDVPVENVQAIVRAAEDSRHTS